MLRSKKQFYKYLPAGLTVIMLTLFGSCRTDFETEISSGNLEFSKDTVYLDTVFTNIGSSTYNLKVYNPSRKDIHIPSIRLRKGENSNYRLNVDGIPGKDFTDVTLLAKDSLFIFVETTLNIENLSQEDSYLYTDQIIFDGSSQQQEVELVTLVKDAVFLYPERFPDGTTETLNLGVDEDGEPVKIEGFFLKDQHLHLTAQLPYVIYGYAAVPAGKTLEIDPGARIHFHRDSGIIVANQASVHANGEASSDPTILEKEIVFQGDRLEPDFANIPGQWGALWFTNGSTNNILKHTTIRNATVGLLVEGNDGEETLRLENVKIYNNSNVGILARTGHITGVNVLVANSGQSAFAGTLGGRYAFTHSTFVNYWRRGHRNLPTVLLSNQMAISNTEVLVADLEKADFKNSIIYGSNQQELVLENNSQAAFNFTIDHSLIRLEDPYNQLTNIPEYDFENTNLYKNSIINSDPKFHDTENLNFHIDILDSAAKGIGNGVYVQEAPKDLDGVSRPTQNPDAGAYQATEIILED